ncbi:LuxR C-terminal-related transcriptional regulator [Telmatobacter bradus]|uniref:LuxR C-terminal-related transcriptional regulator n=1 Tax=Telmatobacter bradus TaxID=474953 RepID=UPI003B430AC3
MRLEGLISIFDQQADEGKPRLMPVPGDLLELLKHRNLQYIVLDLNSLPGSTETLEMIRRERADLRLIVLGPDGDDELIMKSIVAGARAYLGLNADTGMVRKAIDVVTDGSIWAPRHLLSRLIDRLLKNQDTSLTVSQPQMTERERQVLELILMARSNREIAQQLGIEERTVKAYVARLMRKAGADNRIKLSMSSLGLSLRSPQSEGVSMRRKDDFVRLPID